MRYSVIEGSDFYVLLSYDRNAGAGAGEINATEHYVNHLDTETMDTTNSGEQRKYVRGNIIG